MAEECVVEVLRGVSGGDGVELAGDPKEHAGSMSNEDRRPVSALFDAAIESIRKGDVEDGLTTLSEAHHAFSKELAALEAHLLPEPNSVSLDVDIKKIRRYIADGKHEDAALYIGILLLSFPEHPALLKLDREIGHEIENISRRNDLVFQAERQSELGEWRLAIKSYEGARELDPEDRVVKEQMSQALLAWASDLSLTDRKAALNLVQTSLNLREDTSARALHDQLVAAIDKEKIAEIAAEAGRLQSEGRGDEARAQLEAALRKWPGEPELLTRRESLLEEEKSVLALRQAESQARSLLAEFRYNEARQSVENALRQFRNNPALTRLQREIEEQASLHAAEAALSQIVPLDALGTVSALRQALDIALEALQIARDHGLLLKARERLKKRLGEKEGELQSLLSAVEREIEGGDLEAVRDALQKAATIDPENPRLEELRNQMKKARRASVWSWLSTEKAAQRLDPEGIRIGQVLAERYEIVAPLGSGGMSTVYKARDIVAGSYVALKVVLPAISKDPKLREKFKKEVLVARRLSHPNVIRIHDISEHQGVLFISMELVEGQTLSRILAERKRFTVDELLDLAKQFGPALAYIHAQKILHRDIKPQNLMYDQQGMLKVMDFGIARDLSADHTTTAIPMGTPAYMSPELLEGAPLTPASDIYSVGTMFYELLTGAKPFSNASLYERMTKPVPRASQIVSEIPDELDDIIHKCMEMQPERRFQSMEDLNSALAGRTASASEAAGTLAQWLRNEPAKLDDVLGVFLRVLRQVMEIHATGGRPVLTPQSVRCSDTEVEIRSASLSTGQQHTRAIDCKYASGEDFQEAAPAGPASDTYVLGFIFYEILLGRRRFREQFPDCHGPDADLQWLNWHGDPNRSATPLKSVLPDFPAEVSDLIERMMRKKPDQRPALAEVEAALTLRRQHQLRETGKTIVITPNKGEPVEESASRRGSPWALVVAVVVILAVVVWVAVNYLL
jgi:serine/threonine protein kinase/tetratricopeptide (TPR) repeat protein